MLKLLSKTDYILYRECPNNVWVKWNRPDEYNKHEISEFEKALGVAGNEVEALARGKYPSGFMVEKRSEGAQELTKKLIAEKTPVIFQAVFATDKFLAATDILKWNDSAKAYDLYEVKMSSTEEETEEGKIIKNKKKELQFEYDLAFQANVVEMCGVKLNKKFLVRLNKNYVRHGELDFDQLFVEDDKTQIIEDLQPQALLQMEEAFKYLSGTKMPPGPCPCYYKGRSAHCTTFSFINPDVPEYSVHDLNRIGSSKAYLEKLLDEGVLSVDDVPIDERLTNKKLNQVMAHRKKSPIVNLDTLKEELEQLTFPLYFIDYETYPTAIPPFSGYSPYQHIVFQYSLHVLKDKNSEPEHYECLVLEGDPTEKIAESLKKHIGDRGNLISWFKTFENGRNREMARMLPAYKDFFTGMINRTYDLMNIVEGQHYVHPDFKGKSSIKKVLPVIKKMMNLPENELSYKTLGVQNGTDAIEAYRQITKGEIVGKSADDKKAQMLEYCKLDTYAMYILWKFFESVVA